MATSVTDTQNQPPLLFTNKANGNANLPYPPTANPQDESHLRLPCPL